MRELRHDFRAIYHASYDDVPTDEAIDLIVTLPAGSRYRAAKDPSLAWDDQGHFRANVIDLLCLINWRLMREPADAKPRPVERPGDRERRAEERRRAREARERIERTQWKEVE